MKQSLWRVGHLGALKKAGCQLAAWGPDTQTIITPEHVTQKRPIHSGQPQKLAASRAQPVRACSKETLRSEHPVTRLLCPHSHDPGVSLNWLASKKGFASCLSSCCELNMLTFCLEMQLRRVILRKVRKRSGQQDGTSSGLPTASSSEGMVQFSSEAQETTDPDTQAAGAVTLPLARLNQHLLGPGAPGSQEPRRSRGLRPAPQALTRDRWGHWRPGSQHRVTLALSGKSPQRCYQQASAGDNHETLG